MPASWSDLLDGFDPVRADGFGEVGEVLVVLGCVAFGEVGDRLVEGIVVTEVGSDGNRVTPPIVSAAR